MMTSPTRPTNPQTTDGETTSIFALFLRIFWMFIGNVALGISAAMILGNRDTIFSAADIIYGVCVPLLIGARYLDISRFRGGTAYGEPATPAHWRRYTLALLVGSIVVWFAVHGIAYALSE
jgi:hypothetical protein